MLRLGGRCHADIGAGSDLLARIFQDGRRLSARALPRLRLAPAHGGRDRKPYCAGNGCSMHRIYR